ncbi:hypothetical protein H3N56_03400 [Cetobacterium sp. 2A]|uniref:hypothetical protein n=1 Tax=Cetobacterium sp. 2A TaxID=2754723 RepID=UPI00163BB652|nr:hypothetical protein [Cetobacterium sp. 2A]MBC2855541.1 hypothetical protein [Cetobacterium sp. 2A]
MRKFLKKLILFLLFFNSVFGVTPEEAYIEIKAKDLNNNFYMIYYDYEQDIPYLGIDSLTDFLEIKDLNIDRKKIDIPEKLELEDDTYIPITQLKNLIDIKDYTWDPDALKLVLEPNFKLSSEIRKEAEHRIKKFENQKGSNEEYVDVIGEKKLISPGILKFEYSNWDLRSSEYNFGIEYGTQLFYGDFKISQNIEPDLELDYVTLEYDNFLKDGNSLVFGDSYISADGFYDIDRSIRGVSISKNDIFSFRKNNETVISGQVFGANLVELFQGQNLIDYKRLNGSNKFEFIVTNISNFNNYTVKIYYDDGRIEVREVGILSSNRLLSKGESDYSLQVGQSIDAKKLQQYYNYSYGLLNDLTLGTAYVSGVNEDGEKTNSFEFGGIYRTPLKVIPTVIEGKIVQSLDSNNISYLTNINQRFLQTTLFLEYQQFSGSFVESEGYDKYWNVNLSRGFGNLTVSLGNEREILEEDYTDTSYLDLEYNGFRNFGLYMYNDFETPKGEAGEYDLGFKVSYSGFEDFYTILESDHNFDEDNKIENSYSIRVTRKVRRDSKFSNIDFGFNLNYSDSEKFYFGIDFTWYLDSDLIYVETPFNMDDNELRPGLKVEKSILLEKPFSNINTKNMDDIWVEGVVFLDKNGNGIKDEDEDALPEIEIRIGTESRFTDRAGKYIIGNLSSSSIHVLEVNGETLDAMMRPEKDRVVLKGASSSGMVIDIPISPISVITGEIKGEGFKESDFFKLLGKTEIHLIKDGTVLKRIYPEFDGYYYIEDVAPGTYTVKINHKENFENINLVGNSDYTVIIEPKEDGDYIEGFDFHHKMIGAPSEL